MREKRPRSGWQPALSTGFLMFLAMLLLWRPAAAGDAEAATVPDQSSVPQLVPQAITRGRPYKLRVSPDTRHLLALNYASTTCYDLPSKCITPIMTARPISPMPCCGNTTASSTRMHNTNNTITARTWYSRCWRSSGGRNGNRDGA